MSVATTVKQDQCEVSLLVFELGVARVEYEKLVGWLMSQEAAGLPLDQVEVVQEEKARELNRLLLQAHVRSRGVGDVGRAIEVVQEDGKSELQRRKSKTVGTGYGSIFGKIRVDRLPYEARGQRRVHPLDEELSLPQRSFSYELQRRTVKASVQGAFDEAVERVKASTGVKLGKRSAEDLVVEAAANFEEFYKQRQARPPEDTGQIVAAMVDCKGIPMVKARPAERKPRRGRGEKANKKKMATVATVFTIQPRPRTPESVIESLFRKGPRRPQKDRPKRPKPENKRVWASLEGSKDDVIREAGAEVGRRDPLAEKTRVCVTDGEKALLTRTGKILSGFTFVLDLFHVLEKLWAACYSFHKEGSEEAEAWVKHRGLRILQGDVSLVARGMRQSATKAGLKGKKRKVVDIACNYYLRNKDRMKYHEYLEAGLPIASGPVEGACKNLVKDRMERSGMRWKRPMAEAMLRLRATYLSGDFEDYWKFHLQREHKRLYPIGRWSELRDSA